MLQSVAPARLTRRRGSTLVKRQVSAGGSPALDALCGYGIMLLLRVVFVPLTKRYQLAPHPSHNQGLGLLHYLVHGEGYRRHYCRPLQDLGGASIPWTEHAESEREGSGSIQLLADLCLSQVGFPQD